MAKPALDKVEQAIIALYRGDNSVNQWLSSFDNEHWAWELGIDLMNSAQSEEARFFGGSLLVRKARTSWKTLEDANRVQVQQQLLHTLGRAESSKALCERISLALALLSIRFASGTGISGLLSDPGVHALPVDRLLSLLTLLAEELEAESEHRAHVTNDLRCTTPVVIGLLQAVLLPGSPLPAALPIAQLAALQQGGGGGASAATQALLAALATPAARAAALRCLAQWCGFGMTMCAIAPSPLFQPLLAALGEPATAEHAAAALQALLKASDACGEEVDAATQAALFAALGALQPAVEAAAADGSDSSVQYCLQVADLGSEAGTSFIEGIAQDPDRHVPFLTLMQTLLGHRSYRVCENALCFWGSVMELPMAERAPQLQGPMSVALLGTLMASASYPAWFTTWEDAECGSAAHSHTVEQDEFSRFRRLAVYDIVVDILMALKQEGVEVILSALSQAASWQQAEVALLLLCCAGDSLCTFATRTARKGCPPLQDSAERAAVSQRLAALVSAVLERGVAGGAVWSHPFVLSGCARALGACAGWMKEPAYSAILRPTLEFLISLLQSPHETAAMAAAVALGQLGFSCKKLMASPDVHPWLIASVAALPTAALPSEGRTILFSALTGVLAAADVATVGPSVSALLSPILQAITAHASAALQQQQQQPPTSPLAAARAAAPPSPSSPQRGSAGTQQQQQQQYQPLLDALALLGNCVRCLPRCVNPPPDSTHMLIQPLQQLWPVLQSLATAFAADPLITDALCELLQQCTQSLRLHFAPLLQPTIDCMLAVAAARPAATAPAALAVISAAVGVFGKEQRLLPSFTQVLEHSSALVFATLQADMRGHPTLVAAYFQLCYCVVLVCPTVLVGLPSLSSVIQLAVACLTLPEIEAVRLVVQFLTRYAQRCRTSEPLSPQQASTLLSALLPHGAAFTSALLRSVADTMPIAMVPLAASMLSPLLTPLRPQFTHWLPAAFTPPPRDAAAAAAAAAAGGVVGEWTVPDSRLSAEQRARFVALLLAMPDAYGGSKAGSRLVSEVEAKWRVLMVDFARVCRDQVSSADFFNEAYDC